MLDAKFVAANPELVVEKLKKRNMELDLQPFLQAEASRKELLAKVEQMKAERNAVSKEIGVLKKNGQDATPIMEKMRALGDEIDALDAQVKKAEETIRTSLLAIPNIPNESVPFGNSDADNPVQRRWGELPQIENPKNHWEVAEELGILDFERLKSPAHVLWFIVGWALVWSVQFTTSSWMCTPARHTWKFSRLLW